MDLNLVLAIIQLALNVTQASTTGNIQNDAMIAEALVQIAQKASQAYSQQVGQPLDPDLIKFEPPIE